MQGTLAVTELERLATAVAKLGEVHAELRFAEQQEGICTVEGTASCAIELVCQRCLQPMASRLEAGIALAILPDENSATGVGDDWDPVISRRGEHLQLAQLVEDELLLALPIVVFHESRADCEIDEQYTEAAEEEPVTTDEASNPFAVLKNLKSND